MAAYQPFTANRATEPDSAALLAQLKALDASAGLRHEPFTPAYVIKKATAWTGPQITAVQTILDTAPAASPQLTAQAAIDAMSIFEKAIVLTILDQINLIRSKLAPPLGALTVQQMLDAIRTKAGTL